jgi:hypothetical protein
MLINNYSYTSNLCGHVHSGLTSPVRYINPYTMRGYYTYADAGPNGEQIKRDGFPTGTNIPYSLVMGDKGALLSTTTTLTSSGVITAGLASGINILADLDGVGTLTANLSLITSMIAALSGSSSVTAGLTGIIQLAADLSGDGQLAGALNIIAFLESNLTGTSSITAGLRGTVSMEANIYVNQSQASVEELVAGVWNALTADFNASGSMGEAMAAAGSAGDPWITTLPGSYTGDQAGAIVDRLETLIKQVKALTSAGL